MIEFEPENVGPNMKSLHPDHSGCYRPLEPREIRILEFEPGGFDDPLCGRFLYTVLLSDFHAIPMEYWALSYCWGDVSDCVNITLHGGSHERSSRPFRVGRTVEEALRRLRNRDKHLKIWIDAICINQDNFSERSQQVNMMREIYSCATEVHMVHIFQFTVILDPFSVNNLLIYF